MMIRKKTTVLVAGAASLVLVMGGGVLALAGGSGGAVHPRGDSGAKSVDARITGHSFGGVCRMGYDTQSGTVTPPDDTTTDNAAAGSITIGKPCAGAVLGTLSSEVSTPTAGDFIHLDMRATCTGTGGFSNPCTVGQQVFASPGHTFFKNSASGVQVHSMSMMWTGLKKGQWKFEALPGGNASANLQFRTFTVFAMQGG